MWKYDYEREEFATQHGSNGGLGYKVGQFETGYCFGIKIFGANNCLETEASRLAQQMVSHFRANTQSPQGLGN